MESNPIAELLDLAAVHGFYIELLQEALGHPIPVPHEVAKSGTAGGPAQAVALMRNWLDLLDMAIAPPMVRDALKESTSRETAEALLRHFVFKRSKLDADRDKTDFVATFLYRSSVPANQQQAPEDADAPSPFEEEIYNILGEEDVAPLPEEHRQLVREFPFVVQEIEDLRHFDQLMDSGILQRVRDMKQRFGPSFYHPRVMAVSAAYNVYFGRKFDELFRQTTRHIKKFAETVQQQGGSIMTRVEGDVTVKHLTDVEEEKVLNTEYGRAQEHFRKISSFKKAVDKRSGSRAVAAAAVPPPPAAAPNYAAERVFAPSSPAPAAMHPPDAVASTFNPAVEEGRVRSMHDSIRNFVLAADPRSANVFPLKHGNIGLSPAEVEAFRNEYAGEKSFRADYASALRQLVTIQASLMVEMQEFASKQNSAYLWKPHADTLTFLMNSAQKLQQQCDAVLAVAQQRGLGEKVNALNGAVQKLRSQVQAAAKGLEKVSSSTA